MMEKLTTKKSLHDEKQNMKKKKEKTLPDETHYTMKSKT